MVDLALADPFCAADEAPGTPDGPSMARRAICLCFCFSAAVIGGGGGGGTAFTAGIDRVWVGGDSMARSVCF